MDHEPVLITTIALGLTAAFVGAFIARRLRLPAIVGYIAAGVVIGPFTPGFVADQDDRHRAGRDRRDPADVRRRHPLLDPRPARGRDRSPSRVRSARSSSPRSWVSVSASRWAGASVAGSCSAWRCRWRARSSCCARSWTAATWTRRRVASPSAGSSSRTCSRSSCSCSCRASPRCSAARPTTMPRPRFGPDRRCSPWRSARRRIFAVLMIVAGARVVPWLLHQVAREGSRELFTLAVLAIALGHRLSVLGRVRRVVRARGVPGRRGRRRVGHEPPGGPGRAAAARRVRRPVLRVGRDAPRPGLPVRAATGHPGGPRCSSSSPRRWRPSSSWRSPATRSGSA